MDTALTPKPDTMLIPGFGWLRLVGGRRKFQKQNLSNVFLKI